MHYDATFWVSLSFVAFILLVMKPVGRLLAGGLDARADRIKAELDEAVRLKEAAQATLATYQRNQRKALEEVEEILKHAKEEAERITSQAKIDIEEELSKRTELAMDKIKQSEAAVIKEMRDDMVEVVMGATRSLITENMKEATSEAFVDDSIKSISKKFH
jgi:F-type H+-transporting ATPase subunit b